MRNAARYQWDHIDLHQNAGPDWLRVGALFEIADELRRIRETLIYLPIILGVLALVIALHR